MSLERVCDLINQHRVDQENVYLLLDPVVSCNARHPLSIPSLTKALGNEAVVRVARADMVNTPELWPALVCLARPEEDMPEQASFSGEHAAMESAENRRYVCGWLLSEQSSEVIASHIAQECQTLRPACKETFAPWFEPARLALLHSATKKAGEALGPIRSWLYPDARGDAIQIVGLPPPDQRVIPAIVRDVQIFTPHVIQLLAAWRRLNSSKHAYAPDCYTGSRGLPEQAPSYAFNFIHEVHQQGLRDSADVQCLCLHMAMIHPHLLLHPTIQNDVAQAVAGKQQLVSRFATYDDYAWQQIVAALPPARSHS
ncbi:hypothetical protein [Pseudomonas sp. NPDC089401]|uniref:hypothetical protein n=1 Tax=Pseudomonas sp. NPDC089401 TaxID=3364462 RepID=UPI0038208B97